MNKEKQNGSCAMGSLVNNFSFGIRSDKYGEEFLNFCIGRLAEMDHRSKRFVMCDLIRTGLEKSDRYADYFTKLQEEYSKVTAGV